MESMAPRASKKQGLVDRVFQAEAWDHNQQAAAHHGTQAVTAV
jgi:hypothetical protein